MFKLKCLSSNRIQSQECKAINSHEGWKCKFLAKNGIWQPRGHVYTHPDKSKHISHHVVSTAQQRNRIQTVDAGEDSEQTQRDANCKSCASSQIVFAIVLANCSRCSRNSGPLFSHSQLPSNITRSHLKSVQPVQLPSKLRPWNSFTLSSHGKSLQGDASHIGLKDHILQSATGFCTRAFSTSCSSRKA